MIDPAKIKGYIQDHNAKHASAAKDYADACTEYGRVLNDYQRLLAQRIMVYRADRKNLGVDMAQLMALADHEWPEWTKFCEVSERVNYLEYYRKGMEQMLEAYKSESMTIMSLLKYQSDGEKFGN